MEADTTLELTQEELALLIKLLKRHWKWFEKYGAVAPQYTDFEEAKRTEALVHRLEELEGER